MARLPTNNATLLCAGNVVDGVEQLGHDSTPCRAASSGVAATKCVAFRGGRVRHFLSQCRIVWRYRNSTEEAHDHARRKIFRIDPMRDKPRPSQSAAQRLGGGAA